MNKVKYFFLVLLYPLFSIQISAQPRSLVHLQSMWAVNPPVIDGQIDWTDTPENKIKLTAGWMQVQNDADNLYILLDLTMDTSPEEPLDQSPWGDFFAISFDVDNNKLITPNVDMQYGFYPGQVKLGFQYYLEPSAWTGLNSSNAKIASGFNSSYNSESSHRIWETAIPLSEINSAAGRKIRIGLDTYSQNPNFRYYDPPGFSNDFSSLIELNTAVKLMLRDSDLRVLRRRGERITADTSTNKEPVVVKRTINEDGNVELLYSDGSKKRLFDGGYEIITPDGQEKKKIFL